MREIRVFATVLLGACLMLAGCGKKETQPQEPADAAQEPAVKKTIEQASQDAVALIASKQNEDGSFGGERPGVGVTGLVVYAIATSNLADSDQGKATIEKAVPYITKYQREDGSINNHDKGMLANYGTCLAMMALNAVDAEKYKELIAGGQRYLRSTQFADERGFSQKDDWEYGGWDYKMEEDKADPDMSNVQFALAALKDTGVPPDDPAFQRAIVFLQRCQNRTESNDVPPAEGEDEPVVGDDGGAIYTPRSSKAEVVTLPDGRKVYKSYGSMTYALLKSYIFSGLDKNDPRVQAAYGWISKNYTVDENPGVGQKGLFYYYMTMARALTAFGVDTVKTPDGREHNWREDVSQKLIAMQREDGSWVNPEDQWMESDPGLVTAYALTVLNLCAK